MVNKQKFYTGQYAIYSRGIDRFILVDNTDLESTFRTAEYLSSKLPLTVYILNQPLPEDFINYSIFDKSKEKIGNSPSSIIKQAPILKFLNLDNIVNSGYPEDFKKNTSIIDQLLEYAQFVHEYNYAINLTEKKYNYDSNALLNTIVPEEWTAGLTYFPDRSELPNGILSEIKKVLYTYSDAESAKTRIDQLWTDHASTQVWLKNGFYEILGHSVSPLPSVKLLTASLV